MGLFNWLKSIFSSDDDFSPRVKKESKKVDDSSKKLKDDLKINKDSIVTSVCGFETNISLEKLISCIPKRYGNPLDLERAIDSIKYGSNFIPWDGDYAAYINLNDDGIVFGDSEPGYDDGKNTTLLLENIFKKKYLMMRCQEFCYDADTIDHYSDSFTEEEKELLDDKEFIEIQFVNTEIYFNGEYYYGEYTKGHNHDELGLISNKNLLTDKEQKQIEICDEHDVDKFIDGRYSYYFIRKKDFNQEKWWLGWTPGGV